MTKLRQLVALVACVAAVAVAASGCGGSSSSTGVGAVLPYIPADTPFALELDTDLDGGQYKSLDALLHRFPGADTIKALLKAQIAKAVNGADFDKDLKPLLGNPAVISASDVGSFLSDTEEAGFVAALQVADKDALDSLIDKTKPQERGEVGGATVYQDGDTYFGVKDDVVVLAGSRELLEAALKRADGGDHLSEDDFEEGLKGLPDDALARIYVDVHGLLAASDEAAPARKIEWVDAVRTLGLTVQAHDKSIDVQFNAVTEGDDLTEEDLPFATGDEAAKVVKRDGEIGVGLRNPRQLVTFIESALQAVDPQTFGQYEQGKSAIAAKLDLDLDKDVIDQLTGNLAVSATLEGEFAARAELKDPTAFAKTLDKIAKALPQLGSSLGIEGVSRRGNLYEAHLSGGSTLVFGMANDSLIVATDPVRAEEIAGAELEDVPGASGSLVLSADAEGIANQIISGLAPQFGIPEALVPAFARPFGELRGWASTSTDGLKGKLTLTFD
jgi:hypothetical protein